MSRNLTADDRALLREVFRAARKKGWTRLHNDRDYAEPGSRYWLDDHSTPVELDRNGWVKTPISEVESVTVQLAVDVLVAVGVLPVDLHSLYAATVQAEKDCDLALKHHAAAVERGKELRDERDMARAQLAEAQGSIHRLHHAADPDGRGQICAHCTALADCDVSWPCKTIRELSNAAVAAPVAKREAAKAGAR